MQITTREFLQKLGLVSGGLVSGAAFGDEFVAARDKLPPGSCGDPDNVWFGKNIFPLPHTIEDGPSAEIRGGKIVCPAREIPLFHETDVLVVGGGPAGFAAAVAARRSGARVALIERYGSLGGLFTNGLVLKVLATGQALGAGRWRLVTRGLCEEFMNRAAALADVASTPKVDATRNHWQPDIDAEAAKYLMDRMVVEAGVELFFHSWCVDTIQEGDRVRGVLFESKQGKQAILARQIVDCTGDADVAFLAGCDYRQITHGIGHVVQLGNMDRITATDYPATDGAGEKLEGPWPFRSNEGNKSLWWGNYGTGPKGNGLDVRDLTNAELEFRKYWWEHVQKMRRTEGWKEVYLANTCSQIGPRATRLIAAEKVVDRASIRACNHFDDTIAVMGATGRHNQVEVPYGQLVPTKGENILCAGRMLGAPDTCDQFRLIAPCFVTGEAAGTAAALCVAKGVSPRKLDTTLLRKTLQEKNAWVG